MEVDPHTAERPLAGALFVLMSSLMFALMGALVKQVSLSLPDQVVVFFRNFFALLFLLPLLLHSQYRGAMKTSCFRLHVLRCVAGLGAMYCFFYAIARMHLAEAVLLSFTSPLFIPIIAAIWIKEPIGSQVQGAVVLGFLGVILILKPGSDVFQPIALVGLMSGILVSVAMVTVRRLSKTEPISRIVVYFTALSTAVSGLPLIWSWQMPAGEVWWILPAIGLLAVVGQLLLTKGYSLAQASRVGPFVYGNVVFAMLIGWVFWGESLDLLSEIGAVTICVAGILATLRSHQPLSPAVPGIANASQRFEALRDEPRQ